MQVFLVPYSWDGKVEDVILIMSPVLVVMMLMQAVVSVHDYILHCSVVRWSMERSMRRTRT